MAPSRHPTRIEKLPGEVLSEILIRVPAKPLAQMRSVSKPWNHLLSQPSFIRSHLNRSIHNNDDEIILVLLSGTYYGDDLSVTAHLSRSPHLEFPDFIKFPDNSLLHPETLTFFGSVNGLICFGFRTRTLDNDYVIQIWNPSLSAVLTLPPFNGHDLFLIDDDTNQLHFRFGYDPKTDDYKVVKLMSYSKSLIPSGPVPSGPPDFILADREFFNNDVEDVLEVEVYSMRKGSWKLITDRLPSHVSRISDSEVVCLDGHDGHLHWFGYIINGNERLQTIVTFDLGVETFGEICLPDSVIDYSQRFWGRLGVYSGKLCVMSFYEGVAESWIMNEYGVAESWMKLHIYSHFSGDSGDIDPYGFTSTNKFLFITIFYDLDKPFSDHLQFYDPDSEKVISSKIDARESQYIKIVEYVESLVWVAPTDPAWHQLRTEISQIGR